MCVALCVSDKVMCGNNHRVHKDRQNERKKERKTEAGHFSHTLWFTLDERPMIACSLIYLFIVHSFSECSLNAVCSASLYASSTYTNTLIYYFKWCISHF